MASKSQRRGKRPTQLKASKVRASSSSKPCKVRYTRQAGKYRRKTKIHARHTIPAVPLGMDVPDVSPTRCLALEFFDKKPSRRALPAPARMASTDELVIIRNTVLGAVADNNTASQVCEPSVAANDDTVFYTGNWFAAVSTNGGSTFRFVDPNTAFPDPTGMQFCCDQVVHYIKKIDTFVWLLQYTQDNIGGNIQRLAFAKTADVRLGNWTTFDVTPQSIGQPSNLFLDFPDLAVGTNMLYLTTNAFLGENWDSTILLRFPLTGINTGNITGDVVVSKDNFNFRVAQNCGTTAFWASHESTSTLRVFSWAETAPSPTLQDVAVATWSAGNYRSTTPGKRNWLARADPRIVGATKASNYLWFAWGANKGGVNRRPNPYVQIAKINTSTFDVVEDINLWDPDSGICYPALSTNANNEVAVSYAIGGGSRFPSHAVGILTATRRDVVVTNGKRGPSRREWGDYLTVRRMFPNEKLFCATGYTLQAGNAQADSTPNYVIFGRGSDT